MGSFIVNKEWVEDNYHGEADFTIPDGATAIGVKAFYGCKNLISVHIPDGVTRIGWCAFNHCDNLTSVNIPNSVTRIEQETFGYCYNLASIHIPDGVTEIEYGAFYDCKSLTSVNIPDSVAEIEQSAFAGCEGLTSVNIPDSVTGIGYDAFYKCKSLASVNIPDSVTYIGACAFEDCDALKIICSKGSYAEEYAKSNGLETCEPIALKELDELLAQVDELDELLAQVDELLAQVKEPAKIIDIQKEEINKLKNQQEALRNLMGNQEKEARPKSLGEFQIEEFHDEDGQLMPEELSESRLSFTEEDGKFYVNFRHCIDSHDIPDIVTKYEIEYPDIVAAFAEYKTEEKDIQEIFNTFAKSMYHPEKNATSFQLSTYIKDSQFAKDIDEYIKSNSPTLACIKEYSEYFAGGDLAERGCHTGYIKKGGKYYEKRTEFDDYAEADFDTEKSECQYSDIVKALAAAMQTETEYEDVYSGCYDAIVSNGVTYTIADEQLKKDVVAFLKEEQKTVNSTVKQEGLEM